MPNAIQGDILTPCGGLLEFARNGAVERPTARNAERAPDRAPKMSTSWWRLAIRITRLAQTRQAQACAAEISYFLEFNVFAYRVLSAHVRSCVCAADERISTLSRISFDLKSSLACVLARRSIDAPPSWLGVVARCLSGARALGRQRQPLGRCMRPRPHSDPLPCNCSYLYFIYSVS